MDEQRRALNAEIVGELMVSDEFRLREWAGLLSIPIPSTINRAKVIRKILKTYGIEAEIEIEAGRQPLVMPEPGVPKYSARLKRIMGIE